MAIKSLSTAALRREIERRERGAKKVAAKRDKLAKELAKLDAELDALGVGGAPRRGRPPGSKNKRRGRKPGRKPGRKATRGRAKNKMSLADAVAKSVRVGKTVSPAEVMVAIRKVYKSTSKNLGMMVANTLAKHPEFKRLGRGQYQRIGGKPARPTAAKKRKPRKTAGRSKPKARTRAKPKTTARKSPKTRSKAKPKAKAPKPRKTARRSKSKARTRATPKTEVRKSSKGRAKAKSVAKPVEVTAAAAVVA